MANMCFNIINFYSKEKTNLENLHVFLMDSFKKGYLEFESFARFWPNDLSEIKVNESNEYYFTYQGESKWVFPEDLFKSICEKYNVKMAYLAEELGCMYYVTNDISQKFYKEKYILSFSDNDTLYIGSDEELIKTLKEILKDNNFSLPNLKYNNIDLSEEYQKAENADNVYLTLIKIHYKS